jgi:hypothetical protein
MSSLEIIESSEKEKETKKQEMEYKNLTANQNQLLQDDEWWRKILFLFLILAILG